MTCLADLALPLLPAARAGTYTAPAYSGGSAITPDGHGGTTSHDYAVGTSSFNSQNYSGYGGDSGGLTGASCSGQITSTFTWQPAYSGEEPPQDVIVTETGMARATGASYPAQAVGGGCDDGIGQTQSPLTQTPIMGGPYQVGTSGSGFCQGVRYSVTAGGSSVALSCSPSATASANIASATSNVRYSASVSPVTIKITGTYDPDHGDYRVLTGQQIEATLQGIPTGFTVTGYTWSVSPSTTVFKDYDTTAPNSTNATQLVPLSSADLTGPQPGHTGVADLYFYDRKAEVLTVNCSVSLTAPDGTALSVTATSPKITVMKPTLAWTVGGSFHSIVPGFFYNQSAMDAVETWGPISITEPDPFGEDGPNSEGTGILVQIASPELDNIGLENNEQVTYDKIPVQYSDGTAGLDISPTGLDSGFPYPFGFYQSDPANPDSWVKVTSDYAWLTGDIGYSADTPTQPFVIPIHIFTVFRRMPRKALTRG